MVDQTLPLANDLDLIFIYRNGHFAGIYNHFIWPRPIDNGKKGVHFTLHVGVNMGNINREMPELSTVEFLHPELMPLSAVVFQHSRNNVIIIVQLLQPEIPELSSDSKASLSALT